MNREASATAPLSVMQQRMWFMESMLEGRCTYNLCSARRLTGPLDVDALEKALGALVSRHAALRSLVDAAEDQVAVQILQPQRPVQLQALCDLSSLPQPERTHELENKLLEIASKPLNLHEGPLFETQLIRLSEQEHLLVFKIHHIVFDGWSMGLVLRDLGQLYAQYSTGVPASLPELPLSYADFVSLHNSWLISETLHQHVRYWTRRLQSPGEPLALPADRPRPRHPTNNAASTTLFVDRTTTDRLRHLGASQGTSLFIVVLAAYFVLLHKISRQNDIVVGIPVHGRRDFPECTDIVGLFVNTLAVRFELLPQESFRHLLHRMAQTLRDDLSHAHAPLEQVVRELRIDRDTSRSPVYQAFLGFQDIRTRTSEWKDLHLELHTVPITSITEDITCMMTESAAGLLACLAYQTDLFTEATGTAFAARYQQLLTTLSNSPDVTFEELTLCSAPELQRLKSWNDTPQPYDANATIHGLISASAAKHGSDLALQMGASALTHGQLDARANQLAHMLRSRGIARGALVGLCVERSVEMVIAQLAILKAGAAYVPLDPVYPANRLAHMVEDAQLALLLTESSLQQVLAYPHTKSLRVDADAAEIARQPTTPLVPDSALDSRPSDPAYVIYTSGSTGKPKGVVVQHSAVVNFLTSMAREPGLDASARLLAVTTLSF
ncbi:MAG TPA: condensation domain-containing protein, partial [Rhizobacter sp.]|nr:condensation domain-containing protein [Rhizobacter sp.]